MGLHILFIVLALSSLLSTSHSQTKHRHSTRTEPITPKVVIISLFHAEAKVWWGIEDFNILAQNITLPGLSPRFPEVHCTADGDVCQVITSEAEINAASTVTAIVLSPLFDLSKSYFLVAGISGVSPKRATLGSVAFAKYAVQVALQYEFDARDLPANFSTGYVPLGTDAPDRYPTTIYGTEVFELNEALRDIAVSLASTATLNDTPTAQNYRALYAARDVYAPGSRPPSVLGCDVATSDVFYSGTRLSEAFENTTSLWTNGSGAYCMTAQEDNAILEALLRAAQFALADLSRVVVMRAGSNFDRPPPPSEGVSDVQNLFYVDQGGFPLALRNIYLAGVKVVTGILDGWSATFETGVPPSNYVGDIFATLGGRPDFGLPATFLTKGTVADVGQGSDDDATVEGAAGGVKPRDAEFDGRHAEL